MADIKFSEFPKANQSKDSDEIAILQDGVNKMIPSPVLESKIINKTVSRVIQQGGASLNVINLKGVVPTYADLALITPTPKLNDAYQVESDGLVYVYTENGFQADGDGFIVQPEPTGVVEEGNTQAVSGGEVFDKISEIATNEIVINTIRDDNYLSTQYNAQSNVFSGFGFNYGIQNNFNNIQLKLAQNIDTNNKFDKILILIRENDYLGNILFQKEISVNVPDSNIIDLSVDLDSKIINSNNSDIWIEFCVNGNIGLLKGGSSAQSYRYKSSLTPSSVLYSFSGFSTESVAPNIPFYVKLIEKETVLKVKLDEFESTLNNSEWAPKTKTVTDEFAKYDTVITDNYAPSSSIKFGDDSILRNDSTFTGWGQLFGNLSGFNRVTYIVNAFDNTDLPTTLKLIIRKNSFDGQILISKTIDINPVHNINYNAFFYLDEVFENTENDNLFISFIANGKISYIGQMGLLPNGEKARWNTNSSDVLNGVVTSVTTLYVVLENGTFQKGLKQSVVDNLENNIENNLINRLGITPIPKNLLTSKVWLFPSLQYNIYNKNVCVPEFGDNLENYRLDFNGSIGAQFNKGYRLEATDSLNENISLNLLKGREILTTKTQNLLSSDVNNGSGVTRNVLIIGDSTVNGSNISTPLKAVFDADVMNINLIGTLGSSGVNHEGRGGWKISDYYGFGRTLYQINVSGITTAPSISSRYSQGSNTYNVNEVNITGGNGYFSVSIVSGSAPTASGTLTKISGSGDASITYSSMIQTSANPFYNPSTTNFDIGYYLTQTSQTLGNNDWIFFQLGINDVFGITTINSADSITDAMIDQLNYMIDNIHSYNSTIKVGVVITFPPADQDAFGYSYTLGQLSELYIKTGLVTWQEKLIETYDNDTSRNDNIFLVSAHLNLDTDYNYPSSEVDVNSRNSETITMQTNGVHPSATGYAQIADMYAGLIKYFG